MFLKFMKKCSYNVPKSAQNRVVLGALFLMIPFYKDKKIHDFGQERPKMFLFTLQKCSYDVPISSQKQVKNSVGFY
jgi:hypothetical protein